MAYLVTVASTHYLINTERTIFSVRENIFNATEGAQLLYKMTQEAQNGISLIREPKNTTEKPCLMSLKIRNIIIQ